MTAFLITLLVLVMLFLLLPFLMEAFRLPISARVRAAAPGNIAKLPIGATHYRWTGQEDHPVAVCIHGLSTPSYIFAATERSLAAAGYRVLTYDLFGRGYSERVPGQQNAAFFLGQLRALLKDQNVEDEVVLVGFSMGAQIAAAFASEEPERVNKLILVAPFGLMPPEPGRGHWTAPLIGGWLTRVAGGWALRRELVEHRSVATVIPDLEDRQAAETRTRGFLPALLSSRRHLLFQSSEANFIKTAFDEIPTLVIWGADDPVVPLSAKGILAKINPDAHHVQITGAGHNLLQTHPAQVADALQSFLQR